MNAEAHKSRFLKVLIELAWLLPLSAAAGFVVGTVQHFISFGVWGYGFGGGALNLAILEGGTLGAALGAPTGIVALYCGLRRAASVQRVSFILIGTLGVGCVLGAALFWVSAFITPVAAVALAYWVAHRTPGRSPAEAAGTGHQ